ncbi:MAG: hypothetical protein ABI197_03795 [Granulicella sp.]
MDVSAMIAGIDGEVKKYEAAIKQLHEIRKSLQGLPKSAAVSKVLRGRPKGSKKAATKVASAKAAAPAKTATKRKLSPEGRKRIADAMKRRWAERRKNAPAKTAAK